MLLTQHVAWWKYTEKWQRITQWGSGAMHSNGQYATIGWSWRVRKRRRIWRTQSLCRILQFSGGGRRVAGGLCLRSWCTLNIRVELDKRGWRRTVGRRVQILGHRRKYELPIFIDTIIWALSLSTNGYEMMINFFFKHSKSRIFNSKHVHFWRRLSYECK